MRLLSVCYGELPLPPFSSGLSLSDLSAAITARTITDKVTNPRPTGGHPATFAPVIITH